MSVTTIRTHSKAIYCENCRRQLAENELDTTVPGEGTIASAIADPIDNAKGEIE